MNYLILRLLTAIPTALGIALIVFLLLHLIPGDPVEIMLGDAVPVADREALRHALNLDLPFSIQIINYFVKLIHLDLGNSLFMRRPVFDLLIERLPATLELAIAALITATVLALPLGILAAQYKNRAIDTIAMSYSLLGTSIPSFWLGPVLIMIFSLWLGLTPIGGRNGLTSLILPALTLGTALTAILARMLRSSLLETLSEDYIRTAKAKGMSTLKILLNHALPNAWLPVLTLLGLQLGSLLGGAVITETVFDWPGIGSLLVLSIQRRDIPVVQGCVLFISLLYIIVNTLTDLAYSLVDPRIRLSGRK